MTTTTNSGKPLNLQDSFLNKVRKDRSYGVFG